MQQEQRVGSVGVRIARWITMHGFAVNVTTDVACFSLVVPCCIADRDKGVTSLAECTGREPSMEAVIDRVARHFCEVFERTAMGISVP